MATILSQTADSCFSESPITVDVQPTTLLTSSSLKVVCELYVWDGVDTAKPTSPSYTLKKFPIIDNGTPKVVFDFSPILNSFTTASLGEQLSSTVSNPHWFSYEVYEEARSATNQLLTGSHSTASNEPFIVTNGYLKWGEKRDLAGSESISTFVDDFPLLTSAPISQSIIRTDLPLYFSAYAKSDDGSTRPTNIYVYDNLGNTNTITLTSGENNSLYTINDKFISSTILSNYEASGSEWVKVVARNSTTVVSNVKHFDLDCQKKYTPQRIIFRNRAGGFDQFEFGLVSINSMNSTSSTYKQSALNMVSGQYDSQKGTTTFDTQGTELLVVNTDYISEDYNEFFKEMMISDEIYLVKPSEYVSDTTSYGATWIGLTLETKNITFKKSEVDKLVQYTLGFRYGTPFKLVL